MAIEINSPLVDKAIDLYYKSLNMDRDNDSRKNEYSQARMALSNALSLSGMHTEEIAKIINRHRTSVIHHLKHHTGELKHWYGYKGKFERCKMLVSPVLESVIANDNTEKLSILKASRDHLMNEITQVDNRIGELENQFNEHI